MAFAVDALDHVDDAPCRATPGRERRVPKALQLVCRCANRAHGDLARSTHSLTQPPDTACAQEVRLVLLANVGTAWHIMRREAARFAVADVFMAGASVRLIQWRAAIDAYVARGVRTEVVVCLNNELRWAHTWTW